MFSLFALCFLNMFTGEDREEEKEKGRVIKQEMGRKERTLDMARE